MAVTLTGAGGLFTRLGKLEGYRIDVRAHQLDMVVETDDVLDQYTNNRDLADILQPGMEGVISATGSVLSTIQQVAEKTVIEMVHNDDPLPSKDIKSALVRLFEQMTSSSDDVDASDVGSSVVADGANVGNGTVIVDIKDTAATALENETIKPEDIILECTSDAQESGTSSQETFSVKGEAPIADRNDRNWPGGSGISKSQAVSSPDLDAQTGVGKNKCTNSDMEDITADQLASWTYDVGAVTTNFKEEATNHYRGSKAIMFKDTGGTVLTKMSQTLAKGLIKPLTKYMFSVRLARHTDVTGGVLRISVKTDGTSTILSNSDFSVTLSGVGVRPIYTHHTKVWESPRDIPDSMEVVVELTTALAGLTQEIFIDDLMLIEMPQFDGPNGPYIAIIPGKTPFIREDKFTVTLTNDEAGQFQRAFDRWFDMHGKGIKIPSDTGAAETILDTLIS